MARLLTQFQRRRKAVCSNCGLATLHVVTYRLDEAPNWWCTRCGGWTVAGMTYFPGDRRMAAAARKVYMAVPAWTHIRQREWRRFRRHITEGVTLDETDARV